MSSADDHKPEEECGLFGDLFGAEEVEVECVNKMSLPANAVCVRVQGKLQTYTATSIALEELLGKGEPTLSFTEAAARFHSSLGKELEDGCAAMDAERPSDVSRVAIAADHELIEEGYPLHPLRSSCAGLRPAPSLAAQRLPLLLDDYHRTCPNNEMPLSSLTVMQLQKRHSLWGHMLWNAAQFIAKHIVRGSISVRGKTVLELGAGVGLPGIVAARCGARRVVFTDYPDESLLTLLHLNVAANVPGVPPPSTIVAGDVRFSASSAPTSRTRDDGCSTMDERRPPAAEAMIAEGEEGAADDAAADAPPDEDTAALPEAVAASTEFSAKPCTAPVVPRPSPRCAIDILPLLWGNPAHLARVLQPVGSSGYDVMLLSDTIFNHVCHRDLLATVVACLARTPTATAYVVFSHHNAHRAANDLVFFDGCRGAGLTFAKCAEEYYSAMFPEDAGSERVRSLVHCFVLRWASDEAGAPIANHDWMCEVLRADRAEVEAASSATLDADSLSVSESAATDGDAAPDAAKTAPSQRRTPPRTEVYSATPDCVYDVIIQGTGLTESLVSAALARAGRRVLHVDHNPHFGSAFFSDALETVHKYLMSGNDDHQLDAHPHERKRSGPFQCVCFCNRLFSSVEEAISGETQPEGGGGDAPKVAKEQLVSSSAAIPLKTSPPFAPHALRRLLIDTMPMFHAARSPLVNTLMQSNAAKYMEFALVERVALLTISLVDPSKKVPQDASEEHVEAATVVGEDVALRPSVDRRAELHRVPFSKADIFRQRRVFCHPLELRRLDRLVKDLMRSLPTDEREVESGDEEDLGRRVQERSVRAGGGDAAADSGGTETAPLTFVPPWNAEAQREDEAINTFLSRVYGLSPASISFLLLGGALVPSTDVSCTFSHSICCTTPPRPPCTARAMRDVQVATASVGRFADANRPRGAETPFLAPLYGSSELPQSLCRLTAVFRGAFVLRRCLTALDVDQNNGSPAFAEGVAISGEYWPWSRVSRETFPIRAQLSNGQHVYAKAVVLAEELASRVHVEQWAVEKPDEAVILHEPRAAAQLIRTPGTFGALQGKPAAPPPGLHRAILVTTQALVTWSTLEAHCQDVVLHDDSSLQTDEALVRSRQQFPLCVVVLRGEVKRGDEVVRMPPVVVHQIGASTQQVPSGGALLSASGDAADAATDAPPAAISILHFTAEAHQLTRPEFEAVVMACVTDVDGPSVASERPAGSVPLIPKQSVLYGCHFTLCGAAAALQSAGTATASPSHPALRLCTSGPPSDAAVSDASLPRLEDMAVFTVPTLLTSNPPSTEDTPAVASAEINTRTGSRRSAPRARVPVALLNDGAYCTEAEIVFHAVQAHLASDGKPVTGGPTRKLRFLERFDDPGELIGAS